MAGKSITLQKVAKHSHGKRETGNFLIHGDNSLIISSMSADYVDKIKCIYIDPPYNNGDEYNHYSDNHEHEIWLTKIREVLKKLKPLLHPAGSIWISIDDSEMAYLKTEADKIFGRSNFVSTIIWQQRTTRENRSTFSNNHEYVLVYAKNPKLFKENRNLLPLTPDVLLRYKNPDNDERGPWQSVSANVQAGHAVASQFYSIKSPKGKLHSPPQGRCWAYNEERMKKEVAANNIWFGKDGNSVPRIKKFLNGAARGLTPETLWLASEVGTSDSAKKHLLDILDKDDVVFDTPKPEQLLAKIISIATNPGDLVFDCYLGSGTTAAVAHKMQRKYIGVEDGTHIFDIAVKRMRSVIDGIDKGGVSKTYEWRGGGGFDFLRLK